jgi:branched-chain amino acid transport system permease protein
MAKDHATTQILAPGGATPATGAHRRPPADPPPASTWRPWTIGIGVALLLALLPLSDQVLPAGGRFSSLLVQVFVYALMALGLTIITGFTGVLHLGVAAFMAIGVYAYAICTCPIYPFQVGFTAGLIIATAIGALAGVVLGLPTIRLRGDYLAIVTLAFGEIAQDCLRNLESVTKGTTGLNPLPGAFAHTASYHPTYYLYLALLGIAVLLVHHLHRSRTGRAWLAIRDDALAARSSGIGVARHKLTAFAIAAALCAAAGALFAALRGTSIEPGYYDFQNSMMVLASVIIGGLGSIGGALLGALLVFGFNLILLSRLAEWLAGGSAGGGNVIANPLNWKMLIFGLVLVLMMRFRPQGIIPADEGRR